MEQHDTMDMLELLIRPAFCVENGVVVRTNKAAQNRMIEVGSPISALLLTGQQEYTEFSGGCLYLTLTVAGTVQEASVVRMTPYDVFLLEEDTDHAQLRAMALAAQNLREPLSSIMTVADRLFPLAEQLDDPNTRDHIARINRGLFQMLRILGNMSDADRYRSHSLFQQETHNATDYMQDLMERIITTTESTGVEIRFTNLREPVFCLLDTEKLERAIYNLISNALKFTPVGGTIDVRLTCREQKLYLTVQDTGRGIPDCQRSSIYHRFRRDPGMEDSRQGIGLGMVLIRAAATAHSGTVLIDHPDEQGTRVTMTLAIRQSDGRTLRSPGFRVDYAGEWNHSLIELSESLPAELYQDTSE